MQEKNYRLSILPLFEDDLNKIVDYISIVLKNPFAANKLVDDIENAIRKRLDMPLSFAEYQSRKHRTNKYYRINVKNYSIFYVVIDDIMEVHRIIYNKRDIDNIL